MTTTTATKLRHIHLPSWPHASPPRFPTYALATAVQTEAQQRLLAWKAAVAASAAAVGTSNPQPPHPPPPPPPEPTLLTFTPTPTYTLGRRQTEPLSAAELARLTKPLTLRYVVGDDDGANNGNGNTTNNKNYAIPPTVTHAPRGGLTTYHGPGQVVFWPILDLRSPLLRAHLSVRDYACLLEKTTIAALEQTFGIRGFTTSNPGVWVGGGGERGTGAKSNSDEKIMEGEGKERKIAALGVHLRRHVTGLGVAINVAMPTTGPGPGSGPDADETSNPWARIVACGLGGKGVTSVAAELALQRDSGGGNGGGDVSTLQSAITTSWAQEFATRLGLDGVDDVLVDDVSGTHLNPQKDG